MEAAGDRRTRIQSYVYRALLIFLIIIGLVFVVGSIYGIIINRSSVDTGRVQRQIDGSIVHSEGQIFTGIGRLRISSADPEPAVVVIFVSFIYYPDDRAFSEELALRVRDLRGIIENYIGSFSVAELHSLNEDLIKTELLRRFNAILRLGQLETLFFSDFMIIG